jgi:hypothetical protein
MKMEDAKAVLSEWKEQDMENEDSEVEWCTFYDDHPEDSLPIKDINE